jgi:integrase
MPDVPRLFKRGRIWWTWTYLDDQRVRISTGQRTKSAAAIVAAQLERDSADPAAAIARTATLDQILGDLIRRRREEAIAGRRAEATVEFYGRKAAQISRVLEGDVEFTPLPATQITAAVVDGYISTRRAEGVSDSTIYKELVCLRSALRLAKRSGKWRGDVAEVMPIAFSPSYEPVTRWLSLAELHKLMPQLGADRAARVAWIVATSGCWGESERAQAADVSESLAEVFVRGTKRKSRLRTVPIVAAWQKDLLSFALEHALRPEGGLLFGSWGNVRRDLHAACARLEIKPCSPNDLRRTTAVWLRAANVRLDLIAAVLGHSDTRMVERVYGRLEPAQLAHLLALDLGASVRADWGSIVSQRPETDEKTPPAGKQEASKRATSLPGAGIEPATRGFSIEASVSVSLPKPKEDGQLKRRAAASGARMGQEEVPKVGRRSRPPRRAEIARVRRAKRGESC